MWVSWLLSFFPLFFFFFVHGSRLELAVSIVWLTKSRCLSPAPLDSHQPVAIWHRNQELTHIFCRQRLGCCCWDTHSPNDILLKKKQHIQKHKPKNRNHFDRDKTLPIPQARSKFSSYFNAALFYKRSGLAPERNELTTTRSSGLGQFLNKKRERKIPALSIIITLKVNQNWTRSTI